ncbi:ribokinase [Ramlibacter sp. G-1-2-2]|uniref:Ribokinase n=1 Tax=Ramlibacter agri TaxID=2728837 RepID=A0A848H8B4_9BURK|nr:ribokinase [Ramlibacter agri]NML47226.1 ribokinase [Ramlibacter agri]
MSVAVFGSLNMDLVVRVPRMPEAGETLTGRSFLTNPGGKGANQAVACARQGARVAMVGRVGDDAFGAELRSALAVQGVDASGVLETPGVSTGVAAILVDDGAQNCISVVPGANGQVAEADADAMRLAGTKLLLLQLEVPMAAVLRAAQVARAAGCQVLLNPAPAQALPEALWPLVDILVLNEIEAKLLGGLADVHAGNAAEAAAQLSARGPRDVIVTLGAEGAVWFADGKSRHFPAPQVRAVDTTAAGDTFIGALAALLVEGATMDRAVEHAIRAAAIAVTRVGAQASMPTRAEVLTRS